MWRDVDGMSTQAVAIVVSVALACIGYVVTHRNSISLAQRREALEHIDAQINRFYGPLYIVAKSEFRIWR